MLHDVKHVAQVCGVSLETARRWKRQGRLPEPARRLLSVASDLGAIAPPWSGWRLVSDSLISPDGLTASPGEVAAIWYYRQLATELGRPPRRDNIRILIPPRLRVR